MNRIALAGNMTLHLEPLPQEFQSSFDLVTDYAYKADAEPGAITWTIGKDKKAGKRLRYPLASRESIVVRAGPEGIWNISVQEGAPILWVARSNKDEPFTYTLVVIGDPKPLLDPQLGFARDVTEIIPHVLTAAEVAAAVGAGGNPPPTSQPVNALLNDAITNVQLRAELVGSEGAFTPITIDAIDYQFSIAIAKLVYPFPGFALHKASPGVGGYRLLMVLNDGTIGDPGGETDVSDERWKGGGWWSELMGGWFAPPKDRPDQ